MDQGLNDYLAARYKTSVYADQISLSRLRELEDKAITNFCRILLNGKPGGIHPPIDYEFKRRVEVNR